MTRSAADFEIPNRGPSCRIVRFVRQYAATSNMRSSRGRAHGRPPVGLPPTPTPHKHHELAELPLVESREQTNPLRLSRRHHSIHTKIITCLSRAYGTSFS